jgi:delta(3,5)-delta(2,4)-dienoyl-CoA isomerase
VHALNSDETRVDVIKQNNQPTRQSSARRSNVAMERETCAVETRGDVALVTLNRPTRSNALDGGMWNDLRECFQFCIERRPLCVVLRANGKNFCAGIDVSDVKTLTSTLGSGGNGGNGENGNGSGCPGRARERLRVHIKSLQDVFSLLERIEAPVIACVQGACYGAGIDMITACDVRIAQRGVRFCVKEVDLGITADVGTLQRLTPIVGHGRAMELALTAREFGDEEAIRIGLVTEVCDDAYGRGMELATALAKKSPLALRGTKRILLKMRSEPDVERGLDYVATHNAAMLMSDDLKEAVKARFEKREPVFSKL